MRSTKEIKKVTWQWYNEVKRGMVMKMYMMVANSLESVDLLINKLKDDLVQAKFDKEKLSVCFLGCKGIAPALALEIMAILAFYGSGELKQFRLEKNYFDIIRRDIYQDEILIIDKPTIIEKSVNTGALIILESTLFVAGVFSGTAVLKTYGSSLFANEYNNAKVRTPKRDYNLLNVSAKEFYFNEVQQCLNS